MDEKNMKNKYDYFNNDLYADMYNNMVKKKKKKKKKKEKSNEYDLNDFDYSDINYNGDIRKLMNDIADSIEGFLDYLEVYIIFEGASEKKLKKNINICKELIKKLRKGDPSVFDISALNEILASGHNLLI